MPAHRKHPPRPSHRHDPVSDEAPIRTRYGRGARSAPPAKREKPDAVTPKSAAKQTNGFLSAKKATRSSSNVSAITPSKTRNRRQVDEKIRADYKLKPILRIINIPSKWLDDLAVTEARRLREERFRNGQFTQSDLETQDGLAGNANLLRLRELFAAK